MPENPTSFSRNFEDYSAILQRMAKSPERQKQYENYNAKLKALNETIASLTGEGKDVPLSGERLLAIKNQYREAIEATTKYITMSAQTSSGSAYVAGEVERLLRKDLAVIDRIPNSGTVRLSDAFRKARSVCVDVGTATFKGVGGNLSSRMPVTYVDASGVTRQGFFTPNYRIGDYSGLITMYKHRFPQYNDLWNALLADPEKIANALELSANNEELVFFSGSEEDPVKKAVGPIRLAQLMNLKESKKVLAGFSSELVKQFSRDDTYSSKGYLNADRGSSVTDRNCAMSTFADMLGLNVVLAKSEKMVLVRNGQRIEGCFMDTVEGYDGGNLNINDPDNLMWQWAKKSVKNGRPSPVSGNALRQMADLQVLDFLCGNVDRHMYNRLYKFSHNEQGEVVLDGVVGIDNDNAFGKDTLELEGNQHNVGLKALGAISASMARKILGLTAEKVAFMLSDYGLSHDEKKAVAARLDALQRKIGQARMIGKNTRINADFHAEMDLLYVVEDERFKDLTPQMLELRSIVRAGRSRGRTSNAFDHVSESLADAVYEDYVEKKSKEYNPTAVVYTAGTLAETGPVTREDILERFADLHRTSQELYKQAWWNTEEFKGMTSALDTLFTAPEEMSAEEMMALCATLQEKTKEYITRKKDAPDTDRGRERLSFARRLRDLCADMADEYSDSLLRTGNLPQIKKEEAPVIGDGDQMFEEIPLQERIVQLEEEACNDIRQGLLIEDNEVVVTAVARLLHYNGVRLFSKNLNEQFVAAQLETRAVNASVARARNVAQAFVARVGAKGLQELLDKPQAAQRINDEALKLGSEHKKQQKKEEPNVGSRDNEKQKDGQMLIK